LVVKFWYSIQPHACVKINLYLLALNVILSCRVKDIMDLLSYVKQRHSVKAKCTKLKFNSIAEFLKWKEEEEQLSRSYFVIKRGARVSLNN